MATRYHYMTTALDTNGQEREELLFATLAEAQESAQETLAKYPKVECVLVSNRHQVIDKIARFPYLTRALDARFNHVSVRAFPTLANAIEFAQQMYMIPQVFCTFVSMDGDTVHTIRKSEDSLWHG